MNDYARVIVYTGVNVQKGQPVLIRSIVEAAPLVRLCVKHAYEAGASFVEVRYSDSIVTKSFLEHATDEMLTNFPEYLADYNTNLVNNENACIINIRGDSPEAFKGIDPKKLALQSKTIQSNQKMIDMRNRTMSGKNQ
jgi:aminopeptidase